MKQINVTMSRGDSDSEFTTADLNWFEDAVKAAAGYSGKDYDVVLNVNAMQCTVPLIDGE